MVGGKKTKVSKKKSNAEATTSAPPPFPYMDGSFLEFGSEEELNRSLTHFAKRPISPPRVLPELYPQQKGYHDLDNQLQASGLWSFVSRSRSSFNPAFVRAFYSNLCRDGDTIRSSINLYDIEIDLPTFARVVGLPIRGDDIATYGGDDWILNNEVVVIRELGITNLICHSGAATIHSAPPDKRLHQLGEIRDDPHGGLRLHRHGAELAICLPRHGPHHLRRHLHRRPGYKDDEDLDHSRQHLPEESIKRMDWTLQRQHHNMTAYFRGINYVPPPFDTTFLGQNYEGEDEEDNSYDPSSSPDEADFEDAVDGDPMDVEDDEDDDEDADA
ncbi:unnamed protein product [Cuscuta campestris]|uniref:Uncharacterized protein n=1 Tax=Cuscuta campestris TaxID=132261 RepID=A0A484KTY4_9ASTE|nr:unnamed protein product [Cuscuta campestris]